MSATSVRQAQNKVNRMVSVSYFTLGFVIGNLAGITEAAITIPIISGLFAFIGGSAIAMLQKIKFRDRVTASLMVLTICLGLLSGLYVGLWTRGVFPAQTAETATREASNPVMGEVQSKNRKNNPVPIAKNAETRKPRDPFIRIRRQKFSRQELARDFFERYKKYDWDRDTMLKELECLIEDGCRGGR